MGFLIYGIFIIKEVMIDNVKKLIKHMSRPLSLLQIELVYESNQIVYERVGCPTVRSENRSQRYNGRPGDGEIRKICCIDYVGVQEKLDKSCLNSVKRYSFPASTRSMR